ncbi:dTDP-4-amino-4,6-dideoxygalactose transaminase [Vibrio parahaemolyticus]|uniref:dTDP-4-amino-4,6-dideoxygalactose transaminase n=1 Tax=Vibrio parahaemolyticus TaxID=670 RepID=UPI00084AB1E0|nr:dTDP-4-amino-4,6-dideoxygalactose transaminase [Vibrio parahaemolyticus]EGQ8108409.1 dTDP-4-amino-4,6-dideoxygalactose transaminase [Vibrio parahaemolyticus]EGR1221529.1 dTDP-4-amino-4,6-dideoxygalactose transaminase [Vibrio parahaemolyticus]EGR1221918.1 dTDP-4-amino-4,6-dideoxygalactose transaminase [Vibrio parahaemolyticus]EHR1014251.1 dTDP-4-amino-4,6-dideoxygalactose transaminase [Vibrio parahaemolyticus]EHR5317334.1 dTDP-4-amino-4,6-dideoxygalactose transaminase [Vibrio parahaemolyticu
MIPFNKPAVVGTETAFIQQALSSGKLSGDGDFGQQCQRWFEKQTGCIKALLTPSCTHALELAALLIDVQPGDEVIMPSYTFVSTANAFALRGAKIVFVDIRPDTMNIDETKIEAAITEKTVAIVPVHYAGVACEMDTIMSIADKYQLIVIEDAAQGVMSTYKGKALGAIGHLGAYSFHETKNYTSGGEGGLLLISDQSFVERAEIVREKGTNRSLFFRGMVDKYTWVDLGSSLLPSEIQAAYLWGQLEDAERINQRRLQIWRTYLDELTPLATKHNIEVPTVPFECQHNAHMFYLKLRNLEQRSKFIEMLRDEGVMSVFHYIPLHSSPAGQEFGRFASSDNYTTQESERLVRLPLFFNMTDVELSFVIKAIKNVLGRMES